MTAGYFVSWGEKPGAIWIRPIVQRASWVVRHPNLYFAISYLLLGLYPLLEMPSSAMPSSFFFQEVVN
jgi:hypothetical protein